MLTVISETYPQLASSVARAASRADVSKSYVRNEITAKRLKTVRKGRRVLILEEDLQAWLRDGLIENDEQK